MKPRPLPPISDAERQRFAKYYSPADGCWTWTGYIDVGGYAMFQLARKAVKAHRIAYTIANGPIPDGLYIDHICRVRSCVNPAHLRLATAKQNMENQVAHSNNSSGFLGVTFVRGRWIGRIGHEGKRIYVGAFRNVLDAAEAVRIKRLELYTHNEGDRA